ncbi:MAG: alpha/beta fold hydrolase [Rubrivivax sp.]|nr:alpha/beta fold hydrolase [Rubrivivax sp.]HOW48570.1 alpha/beta fold hydrolase [Rubrivivax sp.]
MQASDNTPDPLARDAAAAFDGAFHAAVAPLTGGLSPISLLLAWTDWSLHLLTQPAQSTRLALQAQQMLMEGLSRARTATPAPATEDLRFSHPGWAQWPFAPMVQAYLSAEAWWIKASALRGMSPHHQDMTRAFARQWLDMLSPANFALTNPEVLQRTAERFGGNFVDGAAIAHDHWRLHQGLPPLQPPEHPYLPGVDLAVTPGKVVHRNALAELIQYEAQTPQVQAEPVFIVPSWIMKYYVLDLSPHNSMVRWLVSQGHTVFIVSWRNPDEGDALLDMDDYLELGVFDPLAAIARLLPDTPVHACGYCLGGTLLAIGAAALARPQRVQNAELLAPLASVSLLAAETDFSEPGEMGVLIDASQVTMLEDQMAERGFLTGRQMAGSFQFLHSRELIWSARTRELLLGERLRPNDLMAWNADTTRMPAAMHSEYLRRCYLRNELAEDRYPVEGEPVSLADIRQPIFAVGTEKDHVSPWRSVYKLHRLTDTELCFVLTNGGHNAGIVSEPGHAHRHYALHTSRPGDPMRDADAWLMQAQRHEGSWWTAWHDWLLQHGSGRQVGARHIDAASALCDAPGLYVLVRYND